MKTSPLLRSAALLLAGLAIFHAERAHAGLGGLDPQLRYPGGVVLGAGVVNGTVVKFDSDLNQRMGMALQSDERIVITTGNVLMRLLPNGTLDPSFGNGGRVIHPGGRLCAALAIQNDGKIVTAGWLRYSTDSSDVTVIRYLSDGSVDESFGSGGMLQINVGAGGKANAVALQSDGRIILAGTTDARENGDFVVARILTNGTVDSSFGTTGVGTVTINFPLPPPNEALQKGDVAYGLAIRQDGKILVSGEVRIGYAVGGSGTQFGDFGGDFGDALLSASGIVEQQSFYGGGREPRKEYSGRVIVRADGSRVIVGERAGAGPNSFLLIGPGREETLLQIDDKESSGRCITIQSDGKILVAGGAYGPSTEIAYSSDFAVARYNPNLTLDMTFSLDGMVSFDFATSFDVVDQVVVQSDGRILLAGFASGRIALARLLADGTPDSSFGNPGGRIVTPLGFSDVSAARAIAIQSDGKVIVAGDRQAVVGTPDFAVVRYLADGGIDRSFVPKGGRACALVDFGNADSARAVALQADGKIIIAGSAHNGATTDFALTRLNSIGLLDTSFSWDGKVTLDFSSEDIAHGVAVQADGKIVVVGESGSPGARDFAVARFDPDGQPDLTFGTMGRVLTDFGIGDDVARAVVLQPDGKIVVAGTAEDNSADFALARYLPDGSLDTTFGAGDGLVTTHSFFNDAGHAVALQPDGKIIVAGTSGGSSVGGVRYLADGTLDPAFGVGGFTGAVLTSGLDVAYGVVVQANGRIVIAGHGTGGAGGDFILARFNADGSLDTSFNATGKVVTDFHGGVDVANGLALDANGDIVVVGSAGNGATTDFALARYEATDPDISVFTSGSPELVNGSAAIGLPAALVGGTSTQHFTVRNVGGDALDGLEVTFEGGAAADFGVSLAPVSPVPGPSGSTTLVVSFHPDSDGPKSTLMKIASNDADEAPFRVQLSALALTPAGDYDQDGVNNATEVQLAALGFDPEVDSTALRSLVLANGPALGLYREEDVETLALGAPLLSRHPTTGNFHLILSVEKSPDLTVPGSWTPLFGFDPTYDPQTGQIHLEFAPSAGSDAHFYRILGSKP